MVQVLPQRLIAQEFLEHWFGGRDFIGVPKQPTLTVCTLTGDRYDKQVLHGGDRLHSPTFPTLNLTADQMFAAGQ